MIFATQKQLNRRKFHKILRRKYAEIIFEIHEGAGRACAGKEDRTDYEVSFHFSTTSRETMSDKIKRLIKRDMGA